MRAARASEAVRRALAKADGPILAAHGESLPSFVALLGRAAKLFAEDGGLKDDASPELAAIRSRLRRRRGEVSRLLEKLLDQRREALGDAVVVLRNDRYCLPVLASSRGRVPGIVHDRSGSGQTVFVEPMEVIESNNDLALTSAEERREVDRLLSEFGREVLAQADELEAAVDGLAALDALEAKVAFGEMGRRTAAGDLATTAPGRCAPRGILFSTRGTKACGAACSGRRARAATPCPWTSSFRAESTSWSSRAPTPAERPSS